MFIVMSGKSSDKRNSNVFNEANEALYDAFQPGELPLNFPIDPPWPEWNDADVNAETWGSGHRVKVTTSSKGTVKMEAPGSDSSVVYFVDPEPGKLPPDVEKLVSSWKRPHEIFPPHKLTVREGNSTQLSLTTPSEAAANCELYKAVSNMYRIIHFYAAMEPFQPEYETSLFMPNTKGQPWQPWHHIYGMCKIAKDQPHRPNYSPYGKYILRLYYLGAWRKFVVDDQIPCDENGECMMPVTKHRGELWPILLMKGILKITSLTPTCHLNLMDFPLWSIFTGWVISIFRTPNKTINQIWRLIYALNPEYVPDKKNKREAANGKTSPKESGKRRPSFQQEERPILSIADLGSFPPGSEFEGKTYYVPLLMTREVPLKKARLRKPTERWRRIRWVHWAQSKGIWIDEQLIPPYRCLQVINFAPEINQLLLTDPKIENRLFVLEETPSDQREDQIEIHEVEHEEEEQQEDSGNEDESDDDEEEDEDRDEDENQGEGEEQEEEELQDEEEEETAPGRERHEKNAPIFWADFYKLLRYLTELNFLIKPGYLFSECKMTYMNFGVNQGTGGKSNGNAITARESFTYYFLPTIKLSGNEPPILYCESDTSIYISIALNVCPREQLENEAYLSPDQPEFLTVYRSSLLVEGFDWRLAQQGKILIALKTVGNKNSHLLLKPGRHALRLWLDTDSQFLIDIRSNIRFVVDKGPKIRFSMSTESPLVIEYVNRVSEAFYVLVGKFGSLHPRNLTAFYKQIKPRNSIVEEYEKRLLHFLDAFLASVVNVLHSLVSNEEELYWMRKALRSLFLNPACIFPAANNETGFYGVNPKKVKIEVTAEYGDPILSSDFSRIWTDEEVQKAITIQRIYRGFVVRELIACRSPTNKNHSLMLDKLNKVCDMMFATNKRDAEVARVIREMTALEPSLLETFLFFRDIANVTVTEEFTGKIPGVEPNAWVPMIRFIFACHSAKPLPCAFYYSCNLEQYMVTVTDNDTKQEIFRLINTTGPHYYPRNERGYTLFVYGWNESEPKTVHWRLEMVKMKYYLDIHPCDTTQIGFTPNICHPYRPQPLAMQELRNFYVPNRQNKICACFLRVRKRILVTIRLSLSYDDAKFWARIVRRGEINGSDSEGSLLGETDLVIDAEAKSSAVIFPTVVLDHDPSKNDPSQQTEYVLEAFVLYNSWPLTKHEWGVVELIRMNGEVCQENSAFPPVPNSRKASTASRKKSLRTLKSGSTVQKMVESPYWHLQIVTDYSHDSSNILEATEDRSYQEIIKGMKSSWEESQPGRILKGKAYRNDFLKAVHEEMNQLYAQSKTVVSGVTELDVDGDFLTGAEDSFEALLHDLTSFSYLLNDKSQTRYLKSQRIIPWTPMNYLFEKYSRGKQELATKSPTVTFEDFEGEEYVLPETHRRTEETLQDERKKLLNKMKNQKFLLEDHMIRERAVSLHLMEEAHQRRRKIIDGMKLSLLESTTSHTHS